MLVLFTVYTGEWVNPNPHMKNEFPGAGEEIAYTVVVTNEGTVTLENVEAASPGDAFICDDDVEQPVAVLGVGGSYRCTESRQVTCVCFPNTALGAFCVYL